MPIKIVTDSTSYLTNELKEEFDITVVTLSVNFSTETYQEVGIDNFTFYNKMSASKEIPTSSQPTPNDFYLVFEEMVQAGNSIVGIFISSDMSGTYSSAQVAKKMITDKYPAAVVELIDSQSNCMELGFAVIAAARAAKAGNSIEQVLSEAHAVIDRSRFLFVPETLEYLKKGGRIGGAAALMGAILQIRPILNVVDGKVAIYAKVRTKAKAVQHILDAFFADVKSKGLTDVAVHHINNEAEGKKIAQLVENKVNRPVPVYSIGPVIGLHVGPGTVGLVYYTKELLNKNKLLSGS